MAAGGQRRGKNGRSPASQRKPREPKQPAAPPAEKLEDDVLGALVTIKRDDSGDGFTIDRIVAIGDVRIGELAAILPKAAKVFRERAGID